MPTTGRRHQWKPKSEPRWRMTRPFSVMSMGHRQTSKPIKGAAEAARRARAMGMKLGQPAAAPCPASSRQLAGRRRLHRGARSAGDDIR